MSKLDSADWLAIWDHSQTLPPALQSCALLAPLLADGLAGAERLPVGRRDAHLLDLYGALFCPQLTAMACCGHCAERLELNLNTADLRLDDPPAEAPELQLEWQDYRLDFRLPDSLDLAVLAQCLTLEPVPDIQQARQLLVRRCVLEAVQGAQPISPEALPPDLLQALSEAMIQADPQALIELDMRCPACEERWSEAFDIGSYLLESLEHWAHRTLDQVHLLAAAYGWSEAQILALSPQRRARYLQRVQS